VKTTTITLEDSIVETLLSYTQAKTQKEAIYQAIQEYIRYQQRQELLTLRGAVEIEDNWQHLRNLELTN
jgi:hypothetical protein